MQLIVSWPGLAGSTTGLNSSRSAPAAVTGALLGIMSLGDAHLRVELDLLAASVVRFSAVLWESTLPVYDAVSGLAGNSALDPAGIAVSVAGVGCLSDGSGCQLPDSVHEGLRDTWRFEELSLTFQSSPLSVNGTGMMKILGNSELDAVFHVFKNTDVRSCFVCDELTWPCFHEQPTKSGSMGWTLGARLNYNFTFASIFPNSAVVPSLLAHSPVPRAGLVGC